MDLVTVATLGFFGALLAGGAVGALVGHFSRFEVGLGTGLLIPGAIGLWFAWQCLDDYQAFTLAGPNAVGGEVLEIEDRPVNASGDITTPVPVVRFTAPDGVAHTVRGPSAGGLKPGDAVTVIYDPADPGRSRIGDPRQLRGGAIAMLLFGTFPFTLGLWFLHAYALGGTAGGAAAPAARPVSALRARVLRGGLIALNLAMLAAVVWTGMSPSPIEQAFVEGFGSVAAVLAGYALWGAFSPRANASWCFGMLVLAANFGVWAFALVLLT